MPETTPTPQQQLASDIASLQSKLNQLQSEVRFSSLLNEIEDLQTKANTLPQKIADLRTRGYPFEKQFETRAADLVKRWTAQAPALQSAASRQSIELEAILRAAENQMTTLAALSNNIPAARALYPGLKTQLENLESKASAAKSTLRGQFDGLSREQGSLTSLLDKITWMMEQLSQADFSLLSTEGPIMAVKAIWIKGAKEDNDDPQGVLYLTDQRLLFEQKQEIATKKFLFVTTEKELVQKLLFEAPVVLVEDIDAAHLGLFKNQDHITLKLGSGAPLPVIHFHIDGQDCEEWQGLINRAKTRDFDKDRAIAVSQEIVEKVKSAPSICPGCGATIHQPVLRGMDTLKCEYCGYIIRL